MSTIAPPVSTALLDSLITPDTLADRLEVTRRVVDEWRVRGTGPVYIRVGRTVRYEPAAVDAWLRRQQYTRTSEEMR